MSKDERNNLQEIITQAIEEMKKEKGGHLPNDEINLAELQRRTHISRKKLRHLKANGFVVKPNGHTGVCKQNTVLSGFTGVVDDFLRNAVTNSNTIYSKLVSLGYGGSKTQLKHYIFFHKDLVPAKREIIARQGSRGRRYKTEPGECFQMDWGFIKVDNGSTGTYRAACFAMICHHCGKRYVEFFPDAKQENLFIGMIHAFQSMGVPKYVLTDNMKSVVNGRDAEGHPLWNHDYADFMKAVGFSTKLCKARHPFTKGAVERLVRFVKESFVTGRTFANITDLNYEAIRWCNEQDSVYHQCVDCIPNDEHRDHCSLVTREMVMTNEISYYLCPARKITFDGFVSYEGRRFGVPYRYTKRICRVRRDGFKLYIYADDLSSLLTTHDVTWSRADSTCRDQYAFSQPEEFPTMPVTVHMTQTPAPEPDHAFDRFNFDPEVSDNG